VSNKNEQLIEHWDGKTWTITPNLTIAQGVSALHGVAAISANDVWAVGGPLIEHWDGVSWKVVSQPGASSHGFLSAIAAIRSKDVWAVGRGNGALIEHWDGVAWKVVPVLTASGDVDGFTGVSAAAANDVRAVGSGVRNGGGGCAGSNYGALFGVAAVATNDVWAVAGQPPQGCGDTEPALIQHWSGKQWSVIPNTPDGILYGVSAVSGTDVWAVGDKCGAPLIMHGDGKNWKTITSSATGTRLSSVAARTTDDVWAVGFRYDQTLQQIVIQHWDGHAWTAAQAAGPGLNQNALAGVCAISATEAWAIGYYSHAYGSQQSLIMRYIA
jgi:hypothetical protein